MPWDESKKLSAECSKMIPEDEQEEERLESWDDNRQSKTPRSHLNQCWVTAVGIFFNDV